MPAFEAVAAQFRVPGAVAAASACPPILGVVADIRPGCAEFNSAVVEALRASSVRTVVLAGSWRIYEGHVRASSSSRGSPLATGVDPLGLAAASLAATVESLTTSGYRVWRVRDVPAYGFDVPHRLAITELSGADTGPVGQRHADLQTAARPWDEMFTRRANDRG